MTAEELRHFIDIDGHVGLEEEQEHAARFQKFFKHVAWESRFTLCLSSEEFVKQAEDYGLISKTTSSTTCVGSLLKSGARLIWRWVMSLRRFRI